MRLKLSEQYVNEREEICNKLIEIVGTEFLLCDLDADVEKQQAILALKDKIQKYFAVSSISSYKPCLTGKVKREYFNIVRGILKQQGYNVEYTEQSIHGGNGFYKKVMKYKIFRNNSVISDA
jgi:hypothetical protein